MFLGLWIAQTSLFQLNVRSPHTRGGGSEDIAEKYLDLVEYSPDVVGSHTNSSLAPMWLGWIYRISFTYSGKISLSNPIFQVPEFGCRRSATLRFCVCVVGGPIGITGDSKDSHSSFQARVSFPEVITLPSWGLIRFFPMMIPLHPWEAEVGAELSRKGVEAQYLPRRIRAIRHDGFFRMRQLRFPNRASLKAWMSLKPSPPLLFGWVSRFHGTQHIFFLSGFESHHNLVNADCILLQRETRILKQDMVYAGMDDRTDWSIVSFPALERSFVDQLAALCFIRSTMRLKRSFFFWPSNSSKPRYLHSPPSFWIPKALFTLSLTSWDVFDENVIADLLQLIVWPEAMAYLSIIAFRSAQLAGSALQKNIVSSAKRRWFTLGLPAATFIPGSFPCSCALLHNPDSTSLHRMKRYGDKESPCWIPLCGLTLPYADPLMRKE